VVIPEEFYLAGRRWKVIIADLNGEEMGLCDTNTCTIKLDSENEDEEMEDTFFHELIHAVKYTLGWKDNKKNHHECDSLGGIIMQFTNTKKGQLLS